MAHIRKANGLVDWLDQRLAVHKLLDVLMVKYWIPKQINFLWAMGVILTTLFTVLFITGLLLVMYYKPDTALAFDSVNKLSCRKWNMVGFGVICTVLPLRLSS